MRGPADVGKSVLSSIVVNPDSLPSNLQVENFVYASPYIATDMNVPEEQRQPFRFFANALQAIQSLRDWQPLDMHNTGPAEALMRAGFYSKIVKRERRALVLYDLAGEHFQEGAGEIVAEQAANSDCIYVLLDITCIPIFEEFIEPQNRKERAKKSQFNARLSSSLRQIEGDETPKIIVVTKVDLVDIPKLDHPDFAANQESVESAQPDAEQSGSIAVEAAGARNDQRGQPGINKELALNDLAEIKARVELPPARTSAAIQDLARSNLEKLKSFYDPFDPSQKMIRERLGGETIKGAFFVWTTGLAPGQWGDLPPAAQTDPKPDTASPPDAGPVANVVVSASQVSPGSALTVGAAPPVVDIQPAISCGVLELVKFTLELE
ncbi:MAG: GTPase domain-containing protein, partial [Terracidiphilus sp.]